MIQLPLFPASSREGLNGRELLREFPNSPSFTVRWTRIGPACVHFVELLGVWVASRAAGVHGPSGRVAVTVQYVFPEIFLLHEDRKAVRFAQRAGEPWLDQSYHYVMSCMASGRPILPYEGYDR